MVRTLKFSEALAVNNRERSPTPHYLNSTSVWSYQTLTSSSAGLEITSSSDVSGEGRSNLYGEPNVVTETETTVETVERYQNVHLKVSDIPSSTMFEFMKEVIKTLQSGCQEVNAEGGEGVPEDKIDSPLIETLRQLQDQHGITIEEDME